MRRAKHPVVSVDVAAECRAAWAGLWADNLREQRKQERTFRKSEPFYLTASDLERAIRGKLAAQLAGEQGERWADWKCSSWQPVRVRLNVLGRRLTLLDAVRNWLLRERSAGRLEGFNFGRGHISGMRFRPAGQGLTDVEQRTLEARERRRNVPPPRHLRLDGKLLCQDKRPFWGGYRSNARTAYKLADVTCPRCLKRLTTTEERARAVVALARRAGVAVGSGVDLLADNLPELKSTEEARALLARIGFKRDPHEGAL